jgi:hypothetical protein
MHHFLLFARKRKSYAISEFEFFKVPLTPYEIIRHLKVEKGS